MANPCVCLKENFLLGIGNPLLDISAIVDEEFLKKYDLKPDDAIMAEEKHMPLYKDLMDNYKTEFIAGGSVLNTLRVAQWILKQKQICTYFGCVGKDDFASILRERAIADGVTVQFQESAEQPTGTCAALLTGTHRSLCANLAAAQRFTVDHLATDDSKRLIQAARLIYSSGFFIAVSPESMMLLAEHALSQNYPYVINLSAPFVAEFYKQPLEELLPYVDLVFGNETEAITFAKAFNLNETNCTEIALKIASMPKKNATKPRVVVITQGCEPVILVEGQSVQHIPVVKLSRDQIVDTNGAGDAFAGGFLAQMVLGASYSVCVKCGIYTATHIIQHSGCNFSGASDFKIES